MQAVSTDYYYYYYYYYYVIVKYFYRNINKFKMQGWS
jgi:hypothetical protein